MRTEKNGFLQNFVFLGKKLKQFYEKIKSSWLMHILYYERYNSPFPNLIISTIFVFDRLFLLLQYFV